MVETRWVGGPDKEALGDWRTDRGELGGGALALPCPGAST